MRKIALTIALLSSLLLSACATYTTAAYEQILDTFVGDTENQIIAVWGVPERVFESGDNKYFVYTRKETSYVPGNPGFYQPGYWGWPGSPFYSPFGGTPGYYVHYSCTTTFTFVNGKVDHWQWQGNDCKAPEQNKTVPARAPDNR